MVSVSDRLIAKRNRWTSVKCTLLLTAIALAVWPSGVRAQYFPANSVPETFNDQSTSGVVMLGRPKGLLGPYADTGYFGPYLHLAHTAGDGPGYRDNGFTTLGLFAPKRAWNGMLFFDGRLSVSDFGNMIGNVGGGYRYFSHNQNRMYGGSLWYDVDDGHRSTFSQGGASFETRGENWDFFLNGYFPWGDETKEFNRIVTPTGISTIGFTQRFLAVNRPNLVTRQLEFAMTGFDAELGGPLPVLGKYGIRGYGGYYHFGADNITDVNGGRFRVQAELTDSLSGQFMLTNDNQFDTSVIFAVTWSMPGSGASRSDLSRPGFNRSGRAAVVRGQSPPDRRVINQYYRMFQPTQRSQRVFVANRNVQELEDNLTILTDPVTGQPIVVFHMDSRAAAGGDGSFATPFANPQEAQAGTGPGDTIFTHAGSVFDNPANNFIALQENQQLLGEGVPYFVNTDQFGMVAIPPSGDAGGFPVLQNAGGVAGVTLANGSRLSGFEINDAAMAGILADAGLTMGNSALVENTTINGGPFGLNIMNLGGTVNFATTSSINDTTTAALNVAGAMTTGTVNVAGTINNSAGQAIDVNDLPAGGVVNVTGMVTDVGGGGGGVGSINVRDSAGTVNVVNANLTIPVGDGVTLIDNPLGTIRLGNIDVTTAAGNAFVARNSGNLFVAGGNLNATGGQALFLDDNGTMGPFMINMQLNDVSSTGSTMLNMAGITVDRVSGSLTIAGTATVDTPMGNGIEFIDSDADITIANVDIDDTMGAGIFLQDNSGVMPDLLTGSLIVNGGNIDGSVGPSFQVMNGSATSIYQGNITHSVAGSEMVRITGTSAAANNQFNTGTLAATAGDGILISNADGNASFFGTTNIMGTTRGVLIEMGSTGNYNWGPLATITDTTGNAFEINASSPTSTYSGTINQSLAARAVEINDLQTGGTATFNTGVINATAASTGFRIIDSEGDVSVDSYVAGVRPGARLMNTALEINNSTGMHQFENLDLFTMNGNGVFITNAVQQGTFGVTTGRIDTMGESAIDAFNTNISAVNLTEVVATNTAGNHGVVLNNVGNGTFTISDGDDMTMMDLRVDGTAGGDGIRITGLLSNSLFTVSSADISNTGGGIPINVFGTPAMTNFGKVTIDGTGGGAGIALVDTTGDHMFGATTINDTMGGVGVQLTNVGGDAMNLVGDITFDDGDINTTNDLTITNTGGGDAIDILNPMATANINFAGVNIGGAGAMGLGGGNGVHITGADGMINFGDMLDITARDVTINNTGGGDGIRIEDPTATAMITASTVDIINTGAGNGLNILNGNGMITFGDGNDMTTMDLNIDTMGAGNGINIVDSMATANISFSTVDIATGGGIGINILGTPGVTARGTILFDDGVDDAMVPDVDITGTMGGDGIRITSSGMGANFTFASADIANTMGGHGVSIIGTPADPAIGAITFSDGDATTRNDLDITNTGGGNGIDIVGTGVGGTFTFSSVGITNTGGGNGVEIGDPIGAVNTLGNIVFSDGVAGFPPADLTISDTAGGTGLLVQNTGATTTFASIDISNTMAGNGVSLIDNTAPINILDGDIRDAGGTAFFVDGGNQNVTYSGTISSNTAGFLVDIQNRAGGTVDFNGMLQSTGAGGGIRIAGATAPNTVRFDGPVNLGINNADGPDRLTGAGNAVDIDHNGTASSVVFADLDIFTDGRTGLTSAVGSSGNLAITTGRINTIDAQAIVLNDINMNTINLNRTGIFNGLTVDGAGGVGNNAVAFNNVTGSFLVNGPASITAGATGFNNGIDIDGGTAVYDLSSNTALGEQFVINGATGDAISIANTTGGSFAIDNLVALGIGMSAVDMDMNTNQAVTLNNATITDTGATSIAINDGVNNDFTFNGGTLSQSNNVSTVALTNLNNTSTTTFNATSVINTTNGDGLQFDNVDGATNFTGMVTLNGGDAGIDILNGSAGTFTFTDTDITSPTGPAFNIADSTSSVNFGAAGSITQANNAAAVNVTNHSVGTLDFDSTVSATNGTGLQFSNADGVYRFDGVTTLNGGDAGIDILSDSNGTFTFTDTTITNPTGTAFNVDSSAANVNYVAGAITKNNAGSIINITGTDAASTITFAAGVDITATAAATGINITGATAAHTVNFLGTVDMGTMASPLNGGTAVNINNGGQASVITFADLDIFTSGQDALMAANGGTVAITTGSIDVSNNGIGVNLDGITSNITLTGLEVTNSTAAFDALNFNNVSGTFTTASTTVNGAATRSGIDIDGGDADYIFGTTEIRNTNGASAIDIANTTGGSFTFASATLLNMSNAPASDVISLTSNGGNFVLNGGLINATPTGQNGIGVSQNGADGDISISNFTINGGGAGGVGINIAAAGTSTFQVLLDNNTIGSGAPPEDGVRLLHSGSGTVDATITDNTVNATGIGFRASSAGTATVTMNIGTNGTQADTGIGNDFRQNYVFINNSAMELGVTGNNVAVAGMLTNAGEIATELDDFGNQTNGAGTNVSFAGANDVLAIDPATVLMP